MLRELLQLQKNRLKLLLPPLLLPHLHQKKLLRKNNRFRYENPPALQSVGQAGFLLPERAEHVLNFRDQF